MSDPIKLEQPIEAHGEQLTELTLRRPTVQEVRAIKAMPYKLDKNEDVSLDMDVVAKYIAVLCGYSTVVGQPTGPLRPQLFGLGGL